MLCGAYLEQGCDPRAVAEPLLRRVWTVLHLAGELADACHTQMKPADPKQKPTEKFEDVRKRVGPTMPLQDVAWNALKTFWPPTIVVLSLLPDARAAARDLLVDAWKIRDEHAAGHWLRYMLSVLDDEPILVIEPATKLGIQARISGVADNFQLNVLVMDIFPKSDPNAAPRVSKSVVDTARGTGPQSTKDGVKGVWNLYTWKALGPGGALPDVKDRTASRTWIWNEGIPEDIPVFEGRRVILLGPQAYIRTWTSSRIFALLPVSFRIEQTLAPEEVESWLQRIAAANRG